METQKKGRTQNLERLRDGALCFDGVGRGGGGGLSNYLPKKFPMEQTLPKKKRTKEATLKISTECFLPSF